MSHEIRLERAMQLWLQHARSPECSDAELLKHKSRVFYKTYGENSCTGFI